MNSRDWLMLFVSLEGAPEGLDRVRLQTGMFLLAQEADVPMRERYEFQPYNYGPMSPDVYADLDRFIVDGLVDQVLAEDEPWSRYRPTSLGVRRGHELLARAMREHPDAAQFLYDAKRSVSSATFDELLEDVHARYPDYAARSIFRLRA